MLDVDLDHPVRCLRCFFYIAPRTDKRKDRSEFGHTDLLNTAKRGKLKGPSIEPIRHQNTGSIDELTWLYMKRYSHSTSSSCNESGIVCIYKNAGDSWTPVFPYLYTWGSSLRIE